MSHNLEKYDKLVTALLIIVIFVLGIGWWFAEEKSEPAYLTKIDKLMFDKNNKAPKFVLTLPDKLVPKNKTEDDFIEVAEIKEAPKTVQKEEAFSLERLLEKVPNIFNLPNKAASLKHKYVELEEGFFETTEEGYVLPKKSEEGKKPWIEYGNVVKTQPNFKKVAIIIGNLGFDFAAVEKISNAFDSEVSLSLTPYATKQKEALLAARQAGHETYVDLPLASRDFLREDTGPLSINLNLSAETILDRFHQIINKPAPIGGVIIRDGALYDSGNIVLKNILEEVKRRGLLVVDAVSGEGLTKIKVEGLAHRKADFVIDKDMSEREMEAIIQKAETTAFDKGQVLIVTDSKPRIILALHRWIQTFSPQVSYEEAKTVDISKPFALVPVSNLVVE